jgi:hypothetical protein
MASKTEMAWKPLGARHERLNRPYRFGGASDTFRLLGETLFSGCTAVRSRSLPDIALQAFIFASI